MGLEEKLPSGVLLTSVEKVAGWARARSVWPATFGLACCAIELFQAGGERLSGEEQLILGDSREPVPGGEVVEPVSVFLRDLATTTPPGQIIEGTGGTLRRAVAPKANGRHVWAEDTITGTPAPASPSRPNLTPVPTPSPRFSELRCLYLVVRFAGQRAGALPGALQCAPGGLFTAPAASGAADCRLARWLPGSGAAGPRPGRRPAGRRGPEQAGQGP